MYCKWEKLPEVEKIMKLKSEKSKWSDQIRYHKNINFITATRVIGDKYFLEDKVKWVLAALDALEQEQI